MFFYTFACLHSFQYKILLYVSQQKQVAAARIHSGFILTVSSYSHNSSQMTRLFSMLFLTVSLTFRSSPVATAHFMMTRDWIGRWCLNLRKQLQTFVKRFVFCGFFVVWCCMSSFLRSNNIVSGLSCQSKLQQCVRLGPDPGSCSRWGAVCGERRLFRSGLLWLATARPHHWTGKDVWSMTTFTCAVSIL